MTVKICHITTAHNPYDNRIFHKECVSLANNGFDISIVAPHVKDEISNNIKIIAIPIYKNRFARIFKGTFIALKRALKTKSRIFHFHDPELICAGIILKIFGKKVIYDVHENYSKQILTKEWLKFKIINKILSVITYLFEQTGALFFNGVITVNDDIYVKFNPKKTIIVRNLPIIKLIDKIEPSDIHKDKPVIIYSGGLTEIRGIRQIIESMEFIGNKAELWLMGEWETPEIKAECEALAGWKYVKYIGVIPFGKHYSYIKAADIGIVTFLPFPNHENALPNKPFEYIACSKPIIMSDFKYWQKIFVDAALYVDPKDVKKIAGAINYMLDNPEKASHMGVKGRRLVLEKYNWNTEEKKLLELYNKLT